MSTEYTTADDPSETRWAQTGVTLLRSGWSVGKKVAIAGAAISVAPVVIPPFLVLSAFGLALSVPFGIYYAGMVGTKCLMQFLLPLDQGQEVRQGNQEEGDEIVEEEKGYVDERDFKSEENWERGVEDQIVEEGKDYVDKRDSYPEEDEVEGEDDDAIVENPGHVVTKEHEDKGKGDVRKSQSEKNEKTQDDVVVEMPKERVFVVEENGGRKNNDTRGDADNSKVVVERIIDVNSATVDKNFITMEEVEINLVEPKSTTLTVEGTERAGPEAVRVEIGDSDVVEEKGMVTADTDSRVAKKGGNELNAVSSEDAVVSEVERKSDLGDAESQLLVEHVGEVNDSNALASASAESPVASDVEEIYTKEELWDQLHALRTVVGYKATISKTLPGELRALYVFTGVELPSTAGDASNLLDLNYKLQFLKSVIGVK
ncbi:hypothetical protein FCM35_KLT20931 [Carex littledalei]|uniref:Uncharacterized protein n=1 Tax=Carex littledalei TaxID=544730 RepID=A0A833RAB7_9POAL|nr:hypothetical protein FCM35_KLT20931 [Carex littledalei]